LKSRHLREANKKEKSTTKSKKQHDLKQKRKDPKKSNEGEKENIQPSNDELVEAMNPDEEDDNSNDMF
jgi:hypothetical protein